MRHQTTLSELDSNGVAVRDHLEESVRRDDAGGEKAQLELMGPEFPEDLMYLWEWYNELSMARGVGMHGLDPITYQQIDAWSRLTHRDPDPLEVEAIVQLDLITRSPRLSDNTRKKSEAETPQTLRPMWPTKKKESNG